MHAMQVAHAEILDSVALVCDALAEVASQGEGFL